MPTEELDGIGLAAARGDQAAAERLARAFVRPIRAWVAELVKKWPRLQGHEHDLESEGLLILARRLPDYDGRVHLPAFVRANVRPGMARESQRFISTVGAKLPSGGGGRKREQLDFAAPVFQATSTLGPMDAERDKDAEAADRKKEAQHGARFRLMNKMRKLTVLEKTVVCLTQGIPLRRPSQDRWAWQDAQHVGGGVPEASIAVSQGIPLDEVESALRSGLEKLANVARE